MTLSTDTMDVAVIEFAVSTGMKQEKNCHIPTVREESFTVAVFPFIGRKKEFFPKFYAYNSCQTHQ